MQLLAKKTVSIRVQIALLVDGNGATYHSIEHVLQCHVGALPRVDGCSCIAFDVEWCNLAMCSHKRLSVS